MRKFFSTILLTIFTLSFCGITNASYHTQNDATAEIVISTKEQLKEFAASFNAGKTAQNTRLSLESDLIITEEDNWIPIGSETNPFMGKFNGKLHKIELHIKRPNRDNVGLFGVAKDATFKDLIIEGSIIGRDNVAAFVGFGENLTFDNCYNTLCQIHGNNYVASFLGLGYGNFLICYSYANVSKTGYNMGGFIGYSTKKSFFNMCTSNCSVKPHSFEYLDFCSNERDVTIMSGCKGGRQISTK